MGRRVVGAAAGLLLAGLSASIGSAQGPGLPAPFPLTVDFKRAPVGSWADYRIQVGTGGNVTMKTRWAFLKREATGNTLELSMEGPAAASATLGGKLVTRMVLLPDPIGSSRPIRELVVQIGDQAPTEVPIDTPGLPGQKFQNTDPKKFVGRVSVTVPAGTFATSHYRDLLPDSTVESWLNDQVPPLGVVKIVSTPRPDAVGPGGKPLPPVTMELLGHGKDARPGIIRPARPLDPADRKE
jgi:hypothetical protein